MARQSSPWEQYGSQLRSEPEPSVSSPPMPVKKPHGKAIAKICSRAAPEGSCPASLFNKARSTSRSHLSLPTCSGGAGLTVGHASLTLGTCHYHTAWPGPWPTHLIFFTPCLSLCVPHKSMCVWQAKSSPPCPCFKQWKTRRAPAHQPHPTPTMAREQAPLPLTLSPITKGRGLRR